MNLIGTIRDKFVFLIDNNFKCKTMRKNSEAEIVFIKQDSQLELIIDTYSESLDVVLSNKRQRVNIISFPFSDKSKVNIVKQIMAMPGLINKINGISQFIKLNLAELFLS